MIFLTGPHGGGKTTTAEILVSYNFDYIDLGPVLRKRHKKENSEISFELWCRVGEDKYGADFTNAIIAEEIIKKQKEILISVKKPQDLVIVGSRSFQGIQYIINRALRRVGRKNITVYIDAPYDILKEHYCLKEGKKISFKKFQEIIKRDEDLGIKTIISHADYRIINNSSIEELKKKIEEIIITKLGYKI